MNVIIFMHTLTSKGVLVRKSDLTQDQRRAIVKDLNVCPQTFQNKGRFVRDSDKFKVYMESEKSYRLPRFYALERLGSSEKNTMPPPLTINVPFCGTLKTRLGQDVACQKVLHALLERGGAILSLPTGYGKTTCALYLLSCIGKKTLIIVHKDFLMSQWKERIAQFLPQAKVGTIKQNKFDVVGKDIVVGMLQSLSQKDYTSRDFTCFGTVIIDETHHICSRTFSQAMLLHCPMYILGLSATPERKDGLTCVLNWFVGNVEYSVKRENQSNVVVAKVAFNDPSFRDPPPVSTSGTVSIPTVVNNLCAIEERNALITSCVVSLLKVGRKVIILSERRTHCSTLCNSVSENAPTSSCGLYIGGMHQSQLNKNEECDAIFATYALAHEGLDIPSLNTLVMATPKVDVVQSCGRILRETGVKSHGPLIVDIFDEYTCTKSQFAKRRRFYNEAGFAVVAFSLKDLDDYLHKVNAQ